MLGIQNLNVVYEDDSVTCIIHDVKGDGSLLVFHANVVPSVNRKLLKHYDQVMFAIDEGLRGRGIKEIEAWVNTDEELHYAGFFGFTEYVGELTVNQQRCLPTVHRLRKIL